jgi:beta-glucosidase
LGKYPDVLLETYGKEVPQIKSGEMEIISQPLDFFGANIYNGHQYRAKEDGGFEAVAHPQGLARTQYNWPVTPESLYWGPRFYWERYQKPIVITENGIANMDWVAVDGKVHDPQRIDFLTRYLKELERSGNDGVDLRGYFHWSLMDNFEWQEGYKMRFGYIYVDYQTQQRTLKDSAFWMREVIKTNGAVLHDH